MELGVLSRTLIVSLENEDDVPSSHINFVPTPSITLGSEYFYFVQKLRHLTVFVFQNRSQGFFVSRIRSSEGSVFTKAVQFRLHNKIGVHLLKAESSELLTWVASALASICLLKIHTVFCMMSFNSFLFLSLSGFHR